MGEIYENIDQYLNGTLQGAELKSFEAQLASDKELAELVRQRYIIIQGIKAARKEELKQFIKERVSPSALNKAPLQVKRSFSVYYAAAAASVVIGIAVVYLMTRDPQQNGVAEQPPVKKPVDTTQVKDSLEAQINTDQLAQENVKSRKAPARIREEVRDPLNPRLADTPLIAKSDDKDFEYTSEYNRDPAKVDNKFEEAVVKREEMIWDTILLARLINDPVYSYAEPSSKKATEQARKEAEVLKKDNDTGKKVKGAQYPRSYDRNSNTSIDAAERFTYTVEYWRSPINFQGYMQSGKVIRLYGIEKGVRVELLSYQNKLYLAWGTDFYRLEADGKSHEYVKETDPAILNVLKKN